MPQFILQSSFQFGEVSELLHAQVQSPIYFKAARRLRNTLVIPTGGAKKRFGTKYINTISGITDYTLVKPFFFDYEDGTEYLLIFRNLAIDIYYNDAIVATVVTTYTSSEIANLDFAQSANALFIVHSAHIPAILTRTAAHAGWSLAASPTFINYPTYDFSRNYNSITFHVYKTGTVVPITTAENLIGYVVDLVPSGALFTANHAGGLFFGDSGTIRITSYTSNVLVTGKIVQVFDANSSLFHTGGGVANTISGNDAVLTEVAFSSTRGYPQKVAFYQNRIWFGKTSTLLAGLWGSNFNGYTSTSFNFDDSDDLATNAISTILSGEKSVTIQSILSFKTLVVLTTDGFFSTSLFVTDPLTPTNISFINKRTADSSNNVRPVILDNDVIFFEKGGKKVKNITITDSGYDYKTNVISVLAPHLIDVPYSAATYENSSVIDGAWLMMINSGSDIPGTLAVYQSVPEQEITAWTLSTTDGYYRHVVASDDTVYFIVERSINGATKLFIEKLDFDYNTDATYAHTYGAPTTAITGLSYLEGKSVQVIGDSAPMGSYTVTAGAITLVEAVTTIELGLQYTPHIRPMPLNVPTQMGNSIYLPKSINIVYVDFNQSAGITVNDVLIPPFRFDVDQYDTPVTLKTDFTQIEPFNGWDPRQQIDIKQDVDVPLSFTIIGVGYMVTV